MKFDCIFCKIIAGEIPAKQFGDYGDVLVIADISPKAPVHLLIIPKKHIHDIASIEEADMGLAQRMCMVAQDIAKRVPGASAFRLMINNGKDAGQSVFHLHMHFLAGKKMNG